MVCFISMSNAFEQHTFHMHIFQPCRQNIVEWGIAVPPSAGKAEAMALACHTAW